MTIHCLVDDLSHSCLPAEHGLSLLVETNNGLRLLFDTGQGPLFADNARCLGLSLDDVALAVLSHGHYDHGGGLSTFLRLNATAPVYIHSDAFVSRSSLRDDGIKSIGLDRSLLEDSVLSHRLVSCRGVCRPVPGLTLFSDVNASILPPPANRRLFLSDGCTPDPVTDEQNLIIEEDGRTVLIAGCAHRGIINIMRRAEEITGRRLTHVLAGLHLMRDCDDGYISSLSTALAAFPSCRFVTFHCTGADAYERLHALLGDRICYLSCGEKLSIGG